MVKYTSTEENYLKAIYQLQVIDSNVSTNDIAKHLHTKAATVTDMIKKLKQKSLLSINLIMVFILQVWDSNKL